MNNLWFEIKWHFRYNWPLYAVAIIVIVLGSGTWYVAGKVAAMPQSPAVVTTLAEGTIVGVRATGAWENWCKIELKFDDGTVLLASYGFIQKYNIREGRRYSICHNSRHGGTAMEMKDEL